MTPFDLAQRFVGEIKELAGKDDHPFIQWCLSLCGFGSNEHDETPWCSAFVNVICWMLRVPRSKSALARSWLLIGKPITLAQAEPGYDVVVIKRAGDESGPDVINAPGHVGFFAGRESGEVIMLGGNQGDAVSLARFPVERILGIRRLN